MHLRSLGYRTDLALLQLAGSLVEDRGTHLVVRTPDNPTFYWGNYLLLALPPEPGSGEHWLRVFEEELPDARHRAFGVDATTGSVRDLAELAAHGLVADVSSVMTASAVHPPARPNTAADIRPLADDDDWAQQVALSLSGEAEPVTEEFVTRRAAAQRRKVEAGHGAWFGAFLGGRLEASLGLFAAGPGLARFQEVKTRPAARGQGLCGTLVHAASRFGLDEMGAETLVMVADPEYLAIRIYRSVGFEETETQLGADRKADP
jgi:hypothetical protein